MNEPLAKVIEKIRYADLLQFEGVEIDSPNTKGRPPFEETMLHAVAVWGVVDSARILLDEGAEIDPRGEHGYTPLHEATEQGHKDMIDLLLERGASTEIKSETGSFFDIAALSDKEEIRVLAEKLKLGEQGASHNAGKPAS
ncbi:ankyrin repeat domain-containing protein [Pelagicoccus sp. SDUM812005]|uniref:ankyrin repeat domain-containing protein n=1 Tax=Pelagicoccus sp. SDUM812005 TaxID=3041257 RepID=UPI0028102A49|nr:ankyrin repeat domain-containing protein [Pelagicoccus sp. SDUM812005]MDQ8183856.1 ankyrin repeat domain-containing protein [Pelagicoccus sp. SDUM812005]